MILCLTTTDPEGGFNVVDTRDGEPVAWRGELASAVRIAAFLNNTYPLPPFPEHDSLVWELWAWDRHEQDAPLALELQCERCEGEPGEETVCPDCDGQGTRTDGMIPDSIGGRNELWRPGYERNQ